MFLATLRPVSRYTGFTEPVAREPGEEADVLLYLGKLRPPAAFSATVTDGGSAGDTLRGYQVRTMPVRGESLALAAVTLGTDAGANLVHLARLDTGRDQPAAAALVAREDLVAVKLEETGAAKDVCRFWFGSGSVVVWCAGCARLFVSTWLLLVGRASEDWAILPRPFSM